MDANIVGGTEQQSMTTSSRGKTTWERHFFLPEQIRTKIDREQAASTRPLSPLPVT